MRIKVHLKSLSVDVLHLLGCLRTENLFLQRQNENRENLESLCFLGGFFLLFDTIWIPLDIHFAVT